MFWKASTLGDFHLEASDGAIGAITDCLFDDTGWTARWFVVDTGTWLPGRKVLLSPGQLDVGRADQGELGLGITKDQVRASPPLDSDVPVSRHYEERLAEHYGWPNYWVGVSLMAEPVIPSPEPELPEPMEAGDPHLRSTSEMLGYHIDARDGRIGHIDDFLIDPDGWALRYVVVDTRDWWPGKLVLVTPQSIGGVNWVERSIELDLSRDQIRNGPEYDPAQTIDRAYEERYLGYHGYPPYW